MTVHQIRIALLTSIVAAAAATAPAAPEKIDSSPSGDRILIDGSPSDWEDLPLVYLRESLRILGVAHDEEALYLMFRFGDPELARFIKVRGVMLWFNGDGKPKNKKEEFGIRYPGSKEVAQEIATHTTPAGPEPGDIDEDKTLRALRLTLTGLRQLPGELTIVRMGEKELIEEAGTAGLQAASAVADGVYCYELRIPFAEIGGKVAAADPSRKREVALGIVIGGLTDAEEKELQEELEEHLDEKKQGMSRRSNSGVMGSGPGGRSGSMAGMAGMRGQDSTARRRPIDDGIQWLSVSLPPVS